MSTTVANVVEHEIGPTGLLAIRLHSSAVRLRGVDGPNVRVTGPGGTLERSVRIERGPGSLSIQAIRADRSFSIGVASVDIVAGREAPDLDVEVPRAATVVIETASGDIAVVGLIGDQRYRTTSGEIELRDVSGQLAVDAVSGDVAVTTAGPSSIAARTVSGDLRIRGDHDVAASRIATTSGDVRLEGRFSGPGPFSIETVSGDMILAPHGGVRLEVKTVTGDVRSDVASAAAGGRGARTVVVGGGGATLTIRSISGDVQVVEPRPRDDTPASGRIAIPPAVPLPPAVPQPPSPPTPPTAPSPPDRSGETEPRRPEALDSMTILEALERGDIDVDEASRRLEALDATNPEPEA